MKTTYHSNGHEIIATKGPVVVSIEAPIHGQYHNARLWLRLFEQAVGALDGKMRAATAKVME